MTIRRRPAGRVAAEALRKKARGHAGQAIEALVDILKTGASEHARVAAAKELLDRGHGKPVQSMKLGGDDGPPIKQVIRWALSEAETSPDPAAKPQQAPTSSSPTGRD
jgi:hypothetical protein